MKHIRNLLDRISTFFINIRDRVLLFKYLYQMLSKKSRYTDILDRENNFYPKKMILERKFIGDNLTDVIMEAKIIYWDKTRTREGFIPDKTMERLIPIIEKSLIEYYGKNRRQD